MVATEVRIRRGTESQHSSFIGAQGELTYVTDTKELRLHDGSTAGGTSAYFPSGTVMLFHQNAAPTGWTKDTNATLDNHALRVVTSTAWGSGADSTGSPFTTIFGAGKVSGGTALALANLPSTNHSHGIPTGIGVSGGLSGWLRDADNDTNNPIASNTADPTSGAATTHTHTISLDIDYVSLIRATKD